MASLVETMVEIHGEISNITKKKDKGVVALKIQYTYNPWITNTCNCHFNAIAPFLTFVTIERTENEIFFYCQRNI